MSEDIPPRRAHVERATKETRVVVDLVFDGTGATRVSTGMPFFDHMLDQIGRHSRMDLVVEASGDLEIDAHHTVEDVGLCLGQALAQALGERSGIRRFGDATAPLDEALVACALDCSGRPYLVYEVEAGSEMIGSYDTGLTEHFFESLVAKAAITLHLTLVRGRQPHHIVEACFKSFARALGEAISPDSRAGMPSTKGSLG
jgi:imidazoleglycerol-phosphate dehydratase